MAARATAEGRLKRLLRLDTAAVLDSLSAIAEVLEAPVGGAAAAPAPAAAALGGAIAPARLRDELEGRSLAVAEAFLADLAPLEAEILALEMSVAAAARSGSAALAAIERQERSAEAFVHEAHDLARRKEGFEGEIARIRALIAA
jgi:hypothetical protein